LAGRLTAEASHTSNRRAAGLRWKLGLLRDLGQAGLTGPISGPESARACGGVLDSPLGRRNAALLRKSQLDSGFQAAPLVTAPTADCKRPARQENAPAGQSHRPGHWKRRLLRDLGQGRLTDSPGCAPSGGWWDRAWRGRSRPPTAGWCARRSARRKQPSPGRHAQPSARAARRRPAAKQPARPALPGSPSGSRECAALVPCYPPARKNLPG